MKKKLLNMNLFKKPGGTPVNSSTHKISDISAELDRDSECEYPSKDLRENEPNLIRPSHPDANHGEGSQIANQDRTLGDQQLPTPTGHNDGNASCEWGRL